MATTGNHISVKGTSVDGEAGHQVRLLLLEGVEVDLLLVVLLVERFHEHEEVGGGQLLAVLTEEGVDLDLFLGCAFEALLAALSLGLLLRLLGAVTLDLAEAASLSHENPPVTRQSRRHEVPAVPTSKLVGQTTRTFWASSPFRPGATSNSTAWPSSSDR